METGENNLLQASNFNIALSQQYHLSLEIGFNNCAFCILDTKSLSYTYFSLISTMLFFEQADHNILLRPTNLTEIKLLHVLNQHILLCPYGKNYTAPDEPIQVYSPLFA